VLSAWITTNPLPQAVEAASGTAIAEFGGRIYAIAGGTGCGGQTVYVATFAGGVLGAWNAAGALPVTLSQPIVSIDN